jgi:hypothetical protein
LVEETFDSHRDFEAAIRSVMPPASKPDVYYHFNDGSEEPATRFSSSQRHQKQRYRVIPAPAERLDNRSSAIGGIHATEIDVSDLIPPSGLIRPAKHGPDGVRPAAAPPLRSRPAASSVAAWPKELPLTAQSTTELHARIAVISSNRVAKSKLASAALKRVNETRRRAVLEHKFGASISRVGTVVSGTVAGIEKLNYRREPLRSRSPTSVRQLKHSGGDNDRDRDSTPGSQKRAKQISSTARLIEQASELSGGYQNRGSAEFRTHAEHLLWHTRGKSRSVFGEPDLDMDRVGSGQELRRSTSEPRGQRSLQDPWEVHALATIDRIMKQETSLSQRVRLLVNYYVTCLCVRCGSGN